MLAYPHIKNDLVILRKPETKDAKEFRFLFEHPLSIEKTEEMLTIFEGKYLRQEEMALTILNAQEQAVGLLELYDQHDNAFEVGYRILPSMQHYGYATKAMACMLDWLKTTDIQRVTARIAEENTASQKVLMKNGFVLIKRAKICVYEYDREVIQDENQNHSAR